MRVRLSNRARQQLRELQRYIAHESGYPKRAQAYVDRILTFCERLETFPNRGTERSDVFAGLRVIGFEHSVTIAFIVMEKEVVIEGVFYGGQDIESFSW